MPLNAALVGRSYPASGPFEVGREHIAQFAEAIGDHNPFYRDREVAQAAGHPDVLAPPTFLTVVGWKFRQHSPFTDPELGLDYSRVVHGEQAFDLCRPVYAGDVLSMVTTITGIRSAGNNELLTTEIAVTDQRGERCATLTSTVVSRGTAARAEA